MRIEVDYERCIGSGMCVLTAPHTFSQNDEDGRVIVLTNPPEPSDIEAVQDAVANCPSGALSTSDQ